MSLFRIVDPPFFCLRLIKYRFSVYTYRANANKRNTKESKHMAVTLTTTKDNAEQYLKVLVYGDAGVGKTVLASTVEDGLIVSAESGLLSLRKFDLPVATVESIDDVTEIFEDLRDRNEGFEDFKWVCLDSITEIGEQVLGFEKTQTKDPRQAYGALIDQMNGLLRGFRDLPMNVYMSCKQRRIEDSNTGAVRYLPMMPGKALGEQIPYLFDEVFCLRTQRTKDGSIARFLQTQDDSSYTAKDRSGELERAEDPDLQAIHDKIFGE
jgi:hypothetical protein